MSIKTQLEEDKGTYLHELSEPQIKEQTTTIRPRRRTHLRNLKVRHLSNDLHPRISGPNYPTKRTPKPHLIHHQINRTTNSITHNEVLRRLKVV
jgi:hypothetical protein